MAFQVPDDYEPRATRYYLDENGVPKVTYGRIFIRYTDKWIADHPSDFEGSNAE